MIKLLFLFLTLILVPVVLLSACGGDDDKDDPRAAEVGAVTENVVYAWASSGSGAVHDYLAAQVQGDCSQAELEDALADQSQPTDFGGVKSIKFVGDRAQVQVILISGTDEETQEWLFMKDAYSWRIVDLPGLENCLES